MSLRLGTAEARRPTREVPSFPLGVPHPEPKRPKILIVEDHDDTRQMLRIVLEMKNCSVVEASDGLAAVAIAGRELPDMILMDGSLPLLNGLEATRLIRKNVPMRDVIILALNGWGTPSFEAAALAAGCDECMTKPIDFERLERYMAPLFRQSPDNRLSQLSRGD